MSICVLGFANVDSDAENPKPSRSLSWDFDDKEDTAPDEPVSEVMEFFEMAASLIRTLAPDSSSSKAPAATNTAS